MGVVLTPDFHVACGSHIKLPRGNDFDAEMARSLLTRLHNLHVALNRVSRVCAYLYGRHVHLADAMVMVYFMLEFD